MNEEVQLPNAANDAPIDHLSKVLIEDTLASTTQPVEPFSKVEAEQEQLRNLEQSQGVFISTLQILQEKFDGLSVRLGQLAEAVDLTARQVTFLPPQVRNLSSKVDRAVEAIGESRYQSLLLRLLGIYDLVCQMRLNAEENKPDLLILDTQLRQLLEANGLSAIPTEGRFDPSLHLSVGRVECNDPALDGQVVEVVRPGFKTETSVLRFAEVRVGQCGAGSAPEGAGSAPEGASTASEGAEIAPDSVKPEEEAKNG
jgi:molecular chaperone GrpE (heat shock protein)